MREERVFGRIVAATAVVPVQKLFVLTLGRFYLSEISLLHFRKPLGGTGFAPRDVTPEATKSILDSELGSLMPLVLQAAAINTGKPLATLSRATAGIRNETVVANLPGNPTGIEEILPVLFPRLLHALVDVKGW